MRYTHYNANGNQWLVKLIGMNPLSEVKMWWRTCDHVSIVNNINLIICFHHTSQSIIDL